MLKLEQLRYEHDFTKKKVSEILNVSTSAYCSWENEMALIPTRRIYELANYYHVNIDYMMGLTAYRIELITSDEIDIKIVSKRVREIREGMNESLRKFTKRLNTSSSTWSAYETGKVLILSAFLLEVTKFTEYSLDWILGRSNDKYIHKIDRK